MCFHVRPDRISTAVFVEWSMGVPPSSNHHSAGKYDDNYQMPVTSQLQHAVADGYHIGLFLDHLQEEVQNVHCQQTLNKGVKAIFWQSVIKFLM